MGPNENAILTAVAATAAATAAALAFAQTDFAARKIMDPKNLDAKRRAEYNYHWKTAMEKAYLQINYSLAGGVSAFHNNPGFMDKNMTVLSGDDEMDRLAAQICKEKESYFSCLKIDRDSGDSQGEFFLFLLEQKSNCRYQLPLMSFARKLAKAFEDTLTNTTLCFVADASSGKGSSLLEQLMKESKTGVAVVSQPLWMVQVARLVEANLFPTEKIQKLLFGLARMDAWSRRDEAKDSRTVMITLPGQATGATLLPLVQKCFPEDRHVFVYDGCFASVRRGMAARRKYKRGKVEADLNKIIYGMCQDPILETIPLPSLSPLSKSVYKLEEALSHVPLEQAQVVETWMGTVDAFFKLKANENKNGYLPYILKLKYLEGDFTEKSDSYWSLCSLLQFITGTRSRAMPQGVIDSAIEWLKDYNSENKEEPSISLPDRDRRLIEECVFQHKQILIGDKTLMDTVQPKQHWTLKQAAKKGGCACCGPDPFEEEEEEEERKAAAAKKTGIDMNTPGAFAAGSMAPPAREDTSAPKKKNGFVNGKLGSAFDPTKFS
eukprot:scaffold558_cov111-Cylindrotheca_fusiformis.AAC.2